MRCGGYIRKLNLEMLLQVVLQVIASTNAILEVKDRMQKNSFSQQIYLCHFQVRNVYLLTHRIVTIYLRIVS